MLYIAIPALLTLIVARWSHSQRNRTMWPWQFPTLVFGSIFFGASLLVAITKFILQHVH